MTPRVFGVLGLTLVVLAAAVAFRTDSPNDPPAITPLPATHLTNGPIYWKGNLHTHSLWSDGDDYPEMIADWYKRNGYQFLCLSEHNLMADGVKWIDSESTELRKTATAKYVKRFGEAWLDRRVEGSQTQVRLKAMREYRSLLEEPGRFLLIAGEEVTHKFKTKPVHMNAINLRDPIKPIDGDGVEEVIRVNMKLVGEQQKKTSWPNLTFLNHPNFGWGVRAEEMFSVEDLKFFEVYNGHPGVRNYGDETHASCERIWDIILAVRLGQLKLPVVYGVGTDDAHGYHQFGVGKVNPGRGWTMVRAPYLNADAIVRGMHTGDFYFTTGVRLNDVRVKEGVLSLDIAAEKGINYKTEFIATLKTASLVGIDVKDANGAVMDVTKRYSDEIGKVVATSTDAKPTYKFTGQEWYVRAKVTSDKPHPNPYQKGDTEVAWSQPFLP
jgi:hypothetical protein